MSTPTASTTPPAVTTVSTPTATPMTGPALTATDHRTDGTALMGRRIRWLGCGVRCSASRWSSSSWSTSSSARPARWPTPPTTRASPRRFDNQRGTITASDGTVLAKSVKINFELEHVPLQSGVPRTGPLYAGITGYDSLFYGTSGIEYEYNQYLQTHAQPPAELQPAALRQAAVRAGQRDAHGRPGAAGGRHERLGRRAAAPTRTARSSSSIPTTGAVLAMASNPTYDPNALSNPTSLTEAGVRLEVPRQGQRGVHRPDPMATE